MKFASMAMLMLITSVTANASAPPDNPYAPVSISIHGYFGLRIGPDGKSLVPTSAPLPTPIWRLEPAPSVVRAITSRYLKGPVQARIECRTQPRGRLTGCYVANIMPDTKKFRIAVTDLASRYVIGNTEEPYATNRVIIEMRVDDGRSSHYPRQTCMVMCGPPGPPEGPVKH